MKKFNSINILIGFVVLVGIYTVGKQFYMKPDFSDGQKAPDFIGMMPDGATGFKLSDLKGHYVLLDFWGSWCGPCIAEIPDLKALYQKHNSAKFKSAEGFEIVGVAVEKDAERWKRAIEKHGLPWKYQTLDPVNNFRFFDSPIANAYGVKELPTQFLIDEKGKIVKVNPSVTEVENFLQAQRL